MSVLNNIVNSSPESADSCSRADVGGDRWKQAVLEGEEDIYDTATNSNTSRSQIIYEAIDNSKKVLVTMCVGLVRDDGSPLIDLSISPWSSELKGAMKPTNWELAMVVC